MSASERRRALSSSEMYAMGFAELAEHDDEDGWPYPDDDEPETTESYITGSFYIPWQTRVITPLRRVK
jgi:hypothetical protein